MMWFLLAGVAAFLIWYKFVRPLNYWTRMGVPQTKPWPILGDQWMFTFRLKAFGDFVKWIYDLYPQSRYVGMFQFSTPALVLRDPELIKQITIKDFEHFTDHRPFTDPDIDKLWGNNLFSLTGLKWKEMRVTLSGSFTSSKMKHMFGIINEAAENFDEFFSDKNESLIEVEMKYIYTRYTNDVIATSAFGIKVNSLPEPDHRFYKMGKRISSFSGFITKIKFIIFFIASKVLKIFRLSIFPKDASLFFRDIIHETIRVRKEKGIVRKDMINLLLEARKGNKTEETDVTETGYATVEESNHLDKFKVYQLKKLTDDDITSQAFVFFIAGFDTVSTGLCFGSYELAINKDVQDRLRKEILETHKTNNGKLTYDVLLKMKYMDMVFTEILRKWPPIVIMDRVCTKPYTIRPVNPDEKPINLKVGDLVFLPMHGLHRDPKYYPDPDQFNPERFSDENKDSITPYTFIPFGSGPRNCIGSRFAILEAKALLYHLLLNFEIVPTKKTKIPLKLSTKSLQHIAEGGYWLGLKRI